MRVAVIFGGVSIGPQIKALHGGLDVLVATPGRLLDHLSQGDLRLDNDDDRGAGRGRPHARSRLPAADPQDLRQIAQDAADPVLLGDHAEGNRHAGRRNAASTRSRSRWRRSPRPPSASTQRVILVERLGQARRADRADEGPRFSRSIVFTRTKRGADRVAGFLNDAGFAADAIHGNKSQNQRERALDGFKTGQVARAGRDRYRRARHRRRPGQPCREFRAAGSAGKLRPPHRPHRARRRAKA